jgi:hypothetical protein
MGEIEDGRTLFERTYAGAPVGGGGRCYSTGLTYQRQMDLVSPAAATKVTGDGTNHKLWSGIISVSSSSVR